MELVRHRIELPTPFPWQSKATAIVQKPGVRWVAACMGRQCGKTSWLADEVGQFALEEPGRSVLWTAPTADLASIGTERFLGYWGPALAEWKVSERKATFWNGSTVRWRSTENPDANIGRANHLVVVDEAARTSEDALRRAIMPTVTTTGGKIVAISTPKGMRNWFYTWSQKARSGDSPSYAFVQGPSTESTLPAVAEFVEEMRNELPEHIFRQEFLAEFVDDAGMVFRNVRACATSRLTMPAPGARYAVGCDLAKHEDYTVLAPIDLSTGEVGPLDRFHRISWPQIVERIEAYRRFWNDADLYLDSTGVGDPIFDDLVERKIPVRGVKFSSQTKSFLIVGLANALEKSDIAFPDDHGLIAELESYAYEVTAGGTYRYGAPEGMHDDRVIALALAVYGRLQSWPGAGTGTEEEPEYRGKLDPFAGRRSEGRNRTRL